MTTNRKRGGKAGRKLSAETRKRRIARALEDVSKVSSRDMKSLLSPEQFSAYENQWEYQKGLRQDAADASNIFKRYYDALRSADLLDGKGEKFQHDAELTKKFYAQAEAKYERALEVLDEILEDDPSASRHLDRPRAGWGADKGSVPRVIAHSVLMSKAEVKERALRDALEAETDGGPADQPTKETNELLKSMVAALKNERRR